jgi:preprotein translocase subunit SecE
VHAARVPMLFTIFTLSVIMKKYLDIAEKYYRDVVGEMRKVSWPTKDEVKDMTVVVVTVSGILALFTFAVDWAINAVMGQLL